MFTKNEGIFFSVASISLFIGYMQILVIGAGSAGCMVALKCARAAEGHDVVLLEREDTILKHCMRSVDGRPLITNNNACKENAEDVYSEGSKEMLGLLHRWDVYQTQGWFEADEGLSIEEIEDDAWVADMDVDSYRNWWLERLQDAGVQVRCNLSMIDLLKVTDGFRVWTKEGETIDADIVCLATGITQGGFGLGAAQYFKHEVLPQQATLLDLHCSDNRLKNLQGIHFPEATVSIPEANLSVTGSLDISGKGLGGNAIGQLCSLGIDWMKSKDFKFAINIRWLPQDVKPEPIIRRAHQEYSRRYAYEFNPLELPQRFWERVLKYLKVDERDNWGRVDPKVHNQICSQLMFSNYRIDGFNMWKDEWTCRGGVSLREIDTPSMQSKHQEGVYFVGEMLNIDGLPGGYNTQMAWTTAVNAATAIIERVNV